jgi:flavin reductase (DIM6/NTAB) family NADH-FMN oxidoreductase RutF
MVKKNIGSTFNIYPMPVTIIGTVTDGKPNFMTAAWLTKLNSDPPLLGVSLGHRQHTAKGIRQTGEFSVNCPSIDYCGLVHGYEDDKAAHLEIFEGALPSAPMVRQCPLTMECRLSQTVELPKDYFFIAEVISVYASESVLTDGKVDPVKLRPFVLTMPDNGYWALGERVGDAWDIGKVFLKNNEPTAPAIPNAASTR